jgi:small subunit ribosomal protein S34
VLIKCRMSSKSSGSLFQILNGLRYFGVGSKVTRNIYRFPETYWIVTRVQLSKDQLHGKAWGRMVWRGRLKDEEERIGSPLKKEWSLVNVPDYTHFRGNLQDLNSLSLSNKAEESKS